MEKSQGRGTASWWVLAPLIGALLLICASQATVEAAQHQVGGTPGWSLPSRSNVNYTKWASTQTFLVGDTLYFNYSSAFHNVLQVTSANYDKCSSSSPILTRDDGATTLPLNTTGTFYFICGIPTHCDLGQKVAVLVQATSSMSSTPSTSTAQAPSSSPSASTSLSPFSSLILALSLICILLLP